MQLTRERGWGAKLLSSFEKVVWAPSESLGGPGWGSLQMAFTSHITPHTHVLFAEESPVGKGTSSEGHPQTELLVQRLDLGPAPGLRTRIRTIWGRRSRGSE